MPKQMHEGHRQRMRERVDRSGITGLQPHEVLEYMLYSFIPRRDTNEIAHRLLDEFGSVSGVLNANPRHLKQVKGMTENAALFFATLPEIFNKFLAEVTVGANKVQGRAEIQKYLAALLYNRTAETVYAVAIDVHDRMISCDIISKGGRSEVRLDSKMVVNFAQKHNAYGILLAHNHPSGSACPSTADIALTCELQITLASMGYVLLDHLIFGRDEQDFYSFEQQGMLNTMRNDYKLLKEGGWTPIDKR